MRLLQKQLPGFTLIELIITVAISAIVVGGSIAGFVGFTDRQDVLNTAKLAQQMMRNAQSKARVREVPTGCSSPLTSYEVWSTAGQLRLSAICTTRQQVGLALAIPTDITFTASPGTFTYVRFSTLEDGVDFSPATTSRTLIFSKGSNSFQFTINSSGSISNVIETP